MANEALESEKKLKKVLSFPALVLLTIGLIIGSGVISLTGYAVGLTGGGAWVAYLTSAVIMCIFAIPIAQLGGIAPGAGGNYRYCSRYVSSYYGWVFLVLYIICWIFCLCFYNMVFADFFVLLFPSMATGVGKTIVAMVVFTIFFLINLLGGTKGMSIAQNILTILLIAGILTFVAVGLGDISYPENVFGGIKTIMPNGFGPFILATAVLAQATAGAANLGDLGAEIKNPSRDIPRAMIFCTFGIGILYALVAIVDAGVLPLELVGWQKVTTVADEIFPKPVFYVFLIGACLGGMATTINAVLSFITKPLAIAAADGWLPKPFAKISSRGVPYVGLSLFFVVTMIIIPILGLANAEAYQILVQANALAGAYGAFFYLLPSIALIVMLKKYPDMYAKAKLRLPKPLLYICTGLATCIAIVEACIFFIPFKALGGIPLIPMTPISEPRVMIVYIILAVTVVAIIWGFFHRKKVPIENDLIDNVNL
jgi:APA family basic amino acid/polyamine antiporter